MYHAALYMAFYFLPIPTYASADPACERWRVERQEHDRSFCSLLSLTHSPPSSAVFATTYSLSPSLSISFVISTLTLICHLPYGYTSRPPTLLNPFKPMLRSSSCGTQDPQPLQGPQKSTPYENDHLVEQLQQPYDMTWSSPCQPVVESGTANTQHRVHNRARSILRCTELLYS